MVYDILTLRVAARHFEAKKLSDAEYQQSEQYKTGPKNKDYYPKEPPQGMRWFDVNLDQPLLGWFWDMPNKDLDSNRGYSHPAFKNVLKEILVLVSKGELDWADYHRMDTAVRKLQFDMVDKDIFAKTDAEADPYRFAGRKAMHLWRVFNYLMQNGDLFESAKAKGAKKSSPKDTFAEYFTPDVLARAKWGYVQLKQWDEACVVLGLDVLEDVNAHSERRLIEPLLKEYVANYEHSTEYEQFNKVMQGLVGKTSQGLDYDIIAAGAYMVALLELCKIPEARSVRIVLDKAFAKFR